MKKITAILLSLLCVFSVLLTSCKKKDDDSSDSSNIGSYIDSSSSIAKVEQNGEYTFNFDPYVISEDIKIAMKDVRYYNRFVSAVTAHNTSVALPSIEQYDNIRFAINESFPFSYLISGYYYDSAQSKMIISYKFDAEKSKTIIKEFKDKIQEIFSECVTSSDNNIIAAISLYSYIANNFNIVKVQPIKEDNAFSLSSSEVVSSESSLDTDKESGMYLTLINKEGTSEDISTLYNYLLMQLGIECKTVSSWDNNGEYHTWSLVKLNNKWYHCDIASESKVNGGKGLKYFGMTQDRIESYINSESIYTGEHTWFSDKLPKANSKKFSDFETVISWDYAQDRNGLNLKTESGSEFYWDN